MQEIDGFSYKIIPVTMIFIFVTIFDLYTLYGWGHFLSYSVLPVMHIRGNGQLFTALHYTIINALDGYYIITRVFNLNEKRSRSACGMQPHLTC